MGPGVLLYREKRLFANHGGGDNAIVIFKSRQAKSVREGSQHN